MNAILSNEDDARLSKLLREWKVEAALPPRFQERVWRCIERAEVHPNLWRVFARWVESAFNRPALAVSYVAVLLFIGLAAGYVRAQDTSAQAEARWRTAYVQSVDPYQVPRK